MTLITMSKKELDRHGIIKNLIEKKINGTEAAKLLKLSIRQVRRLKASFKKHGAQGLIHGNRGKISNRKIKNKERKKIVNFIRNHYYDFGPTFATEKLKETHDIVKDPKTIRQIMIDEKLWKPKQKNKKQKHRQWRQRKSCYGEMEQFDGSYEYWFEDRADKCCLLSSIDDASGKITKAKFDTDEGVFPVFGFWKEYIEANGKPRSIYLDKFSTYKMNQEVAQNNHDTLTQFQRAMDELQIEPITAHSPEAKGRVERLFGTLQDRLIKELRLANISNITEANKFLEQIFIPKFNQRFSVETINKTNLHGKTTAKEIKKLDSIFSKQTVRIVHNDFTVSFKKQWLQLTENQIITVRKKDKVIMEERLDSSIHIRLRGKYLNYRKLPDRQKKLIKKEQPWVLAAGQTKAHKPARNHPWRRQFVMNKTTNNSLASIAK